MELYAAVVCALLALWFLSRSFSHIQESTMNAMLAKDWHWIVRHTHIRVGNTMVLQNERIDAAYVTFASEAVEYAKQRHPLKCNVTLTAFACRNAEERRYARELHDMVSARIAEFESEMHFIEQRMH